MFGRESRAMAAGFGIDDEIGVALAVERHRLGTVAADGAKAHGFEQRLQLCHIRRGIFDKFESVGADGIVPQFHFAYLPACPKWFHM